MVDKKETTSVKKEDKEEVKPSEFVSSVPKSDVIEEAKQKNKTVEKKDPKYKTAGLYCVFQNKN